MVERVDFGPEFARLHAFADDGVGFRHLRRGFTGVFLHAQQECRTHAVDQGIGHRRGDDFAAQTVAVHVSGVFLLQRLREITLQLLGKERIFRHIRIQKLVEDDDFVVAEQHRKLRTGQTHSFGFTLGQLGIAGQELDGTVKQTFGFEGLDEVRERTQTLCAHRLHQAQRLILPVVVDQNQFTDFVGHAGQQRIALFKAEVTGQNRRTEQDLDVDFVVGGIDARRVVDEIGVQQDAVLGRFDAAALGHAQIAALAHHPATQFAAIDAQSVVGTVTAIGVGFIA